MVEEGPSEEVTTEAAVERPGWLEWSWKGEREEAGGSLACRAWRGSRAYPQATGNPWSGLSREVNVAPAWPVLIFGAKSSVWILLYFKCWLT